jgi:hypothetical protein
VLVKPYTTEQLSAKRRRVYTKVSKPTRRSRWRETVIWNFEHNTPNYAPDALDIFLHIAAIAKLSGEKPKKPRERRSYIYEPAIPQDEWDALRSAVQQRDGWACTRCGDKDGHHSVHHIDEDKTNNNPDNLATLYWPCHSGKHRRYVK